MLKRLFLLLVPILAAVVPILVLSAPKWWSRLSFPPTTAALSGPSASAGDPSPAKPHAGSTSPGPAGAGADGAALPTDLASLPPLDSPPVVGLDEALRFEVTAGWVLSRWPRVSSGVAELPLQGYRVPLVTGTAEADCAGALTYYFNPRQQVQRITFHGTTGSPQYLIQMLVAQYHFGRRLMNDARVLRFEVAAPSGPAKSYLEIRSVPVVKASDPYRRFEVILVMERPEES